ncbi:Bifunctional purine biosynthesis protein PurH [uncultured archaeon]|nr:Bifunctional purine biosynthesis protein PurH [uncultured archaeon]
MGKEMYRTKNVGEFPKRIVVRAEYDDHTSDEVFVRLNDLRYGTNPHQPAAFYGREGAISVLSTMKELKSGKGGLSQTNLEDMNRGLIIMRMLDYDWPACSIHKHINPCGVARSETPAGAFNKAYWCDARSAFGGTIVFNTPVEAGLADRIMKQDFFECILAPIVDKEALEVFNDHKKYGRNKDIRVLAFDHVLHHDIPVFSSEEELLLPETRDLADGTRILSMPFTTKFTAIDQLVRARATAKDKAGLVVAESCRAPTAREAEDLLFAWYVCANVRSNGVVFAKDRATVAIGTGQQERVGAIEQAVQKAYEKAEARLRAEDNTIERSIESMARDALKGAVLASDGFMPSTDNIKTIAETGVTAVIQPGGSIEDRAVIEAANEHNIAMVFTEERCFSHF